jgi:hypothetical protein
MENWRRVQISPPPSGVTFHRIDLLYATLKPMARAVAKYVFAALLALLTAQTAVPSRHLASAAEIVWCAETEQQAAEQVRPILLHRRVRLPILTYASRISPQPDAPVLFQRPPPATALFS